MKFVTRAKHFCKALILLWTGCLFGLDYFSFPHPHPDSQKESPTLNLTTKSSEAITVKTASKNKRKKAYLLLPPLPLLSHFPLQSLYVPCLVIPLNRENGASRGEKKKHCFARSDKPSHRTVPPWPPEVLAPRMPDLTKNPRVWTGPSPSMELKILEGQKHSAHTDVYCSGMFSTKIFSKELRF